MPDSLLISFKVLNNLIFTSIGGTFYFKDEENETEKFSKLEDSQPL